MLSTQPAIPSLSGHHLGSIATLAISTGILVNEVQLVDDEDGIAEEDYQDYEDFEEEVDEAELIRITNLLSDFGKIGMNNIP